MKEKSGKESKVQTTSVVKSANRSMLLGATFLALGNSVGFNVESAFISPALGEDPKPPPKTTINDITFGVQKDKMQSANKNAAQVKQLLKTVPDSNDLKAQAIQQKLQIEQMLKENSHPTPPATEEEQKQQIINNLNNLSGN